MFEQYKPTDSEESSVASWNLWEGAVQEVLRGDQMVPALYGSLPESAPPRRKRTATMLGVAATAIAAACGLVALAMVAVPAAGRTELNIYQSKYRDVHAGGVWMDCLKCRHASGHCHPTKSEAEGRRHIEANACPPHTGMTTVLMKRNGKIETKWMDKAILKCAMKKMKESMAGGAAPEEEPAEKGEEEEDATPFCVRPAIGERHKWEASDDCTSVADWLEAQGVYGEGRRRRLLSVVESKLKPSSLKPLKVQQLEGEGGQGEEEWDEEGKTPVERWGHDTMQDIYDKYYGDGGGGGGDDEPADDEAAKEKDPCEEVTENARKMPGKARVSDWYEFEI